ncbi:MAG: hypothetical protein WC799_00135 [Desulfobacteraceae bacterium]
MKKFFYPIVITLAVISVFAMATIPAFSNPEEPQCVCAECGNACGSGHASTCSSK